MPTSRIALVTLWLAALFAPAARGADPATQPKKLPYTIAKETTGITAPLRPDGSPDYVAALNLLHNKNVTPENNGFVLFLQVIGTDRDVDEAAYRDALLQALGIPPTPAGARVWKPFYEISKYIPFHEVVDFDDMYTTIHRAPRQAFLLPAAVVYLQSQQTLLNRAVEAAARPHWWIPAIVTEGDSLIESRLPSLGALRDVATALSTRAALRAPPATSQAFSPMPSPPNNSPSKSPPDKRSSKIWSASPWIPSPMRPSPPSSPEARCRPRRPSGWVNSSPHSPRCTPPSIPSTPPNAGPNSTLRNASPPAIPVTLKTLAGDIGPLNLIDHDQVDWDFVLRQINAHMDEIAASMKEPTFERQSARLKALDEILTHWQAEAGPCLQNPQMLQRQPDETRQAYSQRVAHVEMAIMMPSLGKAGELNLRSAHQDAMLTLLVAAAEFHAHTGAWPKTLDALVPNNIKFIPPDMYTQQPLHYLLTPSGPRIYCVCPNQ